MYQSAVLTAIGDPAAGNAQAQALAAYPDNDPMDRPLIRLDQARYLARPRPVPTRTPPPRQRSPRSPTCPGAAGPAAGYQARAIAPAISVLSPQAAGRYHEDLTALAVQ